jgi:hypothetical protein
MCPNFGRQAEMCPLMMPFQRETPFRTLLFQEREIDVRQERKVRSRRTGVIHETVFDAHLNPIKSTPNGGAFLMLDHKRHGRRELAAISYTIIDIKERNLPFVDEIGTLQRSENIDFPIPGTRSTRIVRKKRRTGLGENRFAEQNQNKACEQNRVFELNMNHGSLYESNVDECRYNILQFK